MCTFSLHLHVCSHMQMHGWESRQTWICLERIWRNGGCWRRSWRWLTAADRGKKRPGRLLSNTHDRRRGVHVYVSQDGSTHPGRKRMQKHENTCANFKVVMRRKENLRNKQRRKRAGAQSEHVKCKQAGEIKQQENSWETLQSTFPIAPFSQQ